MKRITSHSQWSMQRELAREFRGRATEAETILWERLRDRRTGGLKFRRQHPVGQFVLDFYCVDAALAVEVDGGVHAERRELDALRQEFLKERGITTVRFANKEVVDDLNTVLARILELATEPRSEPPRHNVERGWPKAEGEVS